MVTRKEIDSSSVVRTLRDVGMGYVLTTESLSCPRLYAIVHNMVLPAPPLPDGDYPFNDERVPLSQLAWIEMPREMEALLRAQASDNGTPIIRGVPVELRCRGTDTGDAIFTVYWPHDDDRLHMLAPKSFQIGRA